MDVTDASERVVVFISYSHDSPEHMEHVLELANRLRSEGIDAEVDRYEDAPPEGWPRWCDRKIQEAQFVLVICTETYLRRFEGTDKPGRGLGAKWEGAIVTQELYETDASNSKFIPVCLSAQDTNHIPRPLRGFTRYVLDSEAGFDQLYRRLTKQPSVLKPELGAVRALPPGSASRRRTALPPRAAKQDFSADARLALYDRRLKVFQAVREILAMMYTVVSNDEKLVKLLAETREADFLFGAEIKDYIEDVYRRASRLSDAYKQLVAILATAPPEARKRLAEIESAEVKWATAEARVVADKFKQYLDLSEL
jgi:hypothetical protein